MLTPASRRRGGAIAPAGLAGFADRSIKGGGRELSAPGLPACRARRWRPLALSRLRRPDSRCRRFKLARPLRPGDLAGLLSAAGRRSAPGAGPMPDAAGAADARASVSTTVRTRPPAWVSQSAVHPAMCGTSCATSDFHPAGDPGQPRASRSILRQEVELSPTTGKRRGTVVVHDRQGRHFLYLVEGERQGDALRRRPRPRTAYAWSSAAQASSSGTQRMAALDAVRSKWSRASRIVRPFSARRTAA